MEIVDMKLLGLGILAVWASVFLFSSGETNGLTPVSDAYARSVTGAQIGDCLEYMKMYTCQNYVCKIGTNCMTKEKCQASYTWVGADPAYPSYDRDWYSDLDLATLPCENACGDECDGDTLIQNNSIPCDIE
tara:strand:+ start:778 stop:1173 length:396 start_codon:yes stop_codon:yes gene_type:complete